MYIHTLLIIKSLASAVPWLLHDAIIGALAHGDLGLGSFLRLYPLYSTEWGCNLACHPFVTSFRDSIKGVVLPIIKHINRVTSSLSNHTL